MRIELPKKITREMQKALTIIETVNSYYNLECRTSNRNRETAQPRQLAQYLIRKRVHMTSALNAAFFDRDHSVVNNSVKIVENLLSYDKKFTKDYVIILNILKCN